MRIALITEFYYPHLGGVTEHVHHLARELRAMGHSATIITSHMAGESGDEPFVRRVGKSRLIYSNGSFARVSTGRTLLRDIERILREDRIELIHLHGALAPTLGMVGQWAAYRLRLPVVATFHSWFPGSPPYRLLQKPMQILMDAIAVKIAVSEPVIQAHSRYFRADWEIIPNGIEVRYFHPNGRQPNDALKQGPRLLFLGRLDPRNGLQTILDAMPGVLARYSNAELVVAGDGPLRSHYERKARDLGASVKFMGHVFEERPDCYGSSDLYLCPTTRASFGITLLEAMACGTPIVASDIIGFRELIAGGREAVMVPPFNTEAWTRAIVNLIDDPAYRWVMRQAGLRKAQEFAWPRIAERIADVYRRALKRPAERPEQNPLGRPPQQWDGTRDAANPIRFSLN
jgi:phosphatidylinositol alpha-mannosyltransferase